MAKAKRLDPAKETVVHIVSDERGWVHTHGLDKHGLPELEVRGVPLFLAEDAVVLLNEISDYLLNSGNPVKPGQTMQVGNRHIVFESGHSRDAALDAGHYDTPRLCVKDDPRMYGACSSKDHADGSDAKSRPS